MAKAICEIDDFKFVSFLDFLNESNESKLIQEIKTKFGNNFLEKQFNINDIDDSFFIEMAKILNRYVFGGKLQKIPKNVFGSEENLNNILNRVYRKTKTSGSTFGKNQNKYMMFFSILTNTDEELNIIDNPDRLNLDYISIFINTDSLVDKDNYFVVSGLCHELIHYYDVMYGQYKLNFLNFYQHKIPFNCHFTFTFNNFQKKANNLGLKVIKFDFKENEKHVANTHIFKARDGKCAVLIEIN